MRRHIQSCRRNRRRSEVTKTASTLRPWVWCKTVQPYFVITYFHSWSSFAKISLSEIKLKLAFIKLKFLHDVTVAILVFLNDETAVMLMFQASLVEIKLSCKLFLLFSWIYIHRCRLREWKRSTGIPKHSLRSKTEEREGVLAARKMEREPKNKRGGREMGRNSSSHHNHSVKKHPK